MLRVDAARAQGSRQQPLMHQLVAEAAGLTKHTRVIGRIQRLFTSINGMIAMRNIKSEKDKMRQLNESVALEEAKNAQVQSVAKMSGIVERYVVYHKGLEYGKKQTLK